MHAASFPRTHAQPSNHHRSLPLLPSLFTAVVNRVSDFLQDRRLGIRTDGRIEIAYRDAQRYQALPYFAIERVLDRLELGPNDVLADLGSGKGRVVCTAAQRSLARVIGIEIDPALHAAAEDNVRRLRGARAPIRLELRDAATFDFADATAVCLCNPFGGGTMAATLNRLRESRRLYPRPVRIAYVNAACAHLLAAQPWLELVETWEMSTWSRIKTPVHFYRTRF
jgi:SAM-dependent methyltransferase